MDLDLSFLANNFITSFSGAFAAAWVVFYLQVRRESKKEEEIIVSFINDTIISLNVNLCSLIEIKRQFFLPSMKEVHAIKQNLTKTDEVNLDNLEALYTVHLTPEIFFHFDKEIAAKLAKETPKCVELLYRTNDSLQTVIRSITYYNDSVMQYKDTKSTDKNGKINTPKKALIKLSECQSANLVSVLKSIDTALYLGSKTDKILSEWAQQNLNNNDKKKLVTYQIGEDHKDLMPPEDFVQI